MLRNWAIGGLAARLQQALFRRAGEQVFISELTQNSCAIEAAQAVVAVKHSGARRNS